LLLLLLLLLLFSIPSTSFTKSPVFYSGAKGLWFCNSSTTIIGIRRMKITLAASKHTTQQESCSNSLYLASVRSSF
jgi:hypothetical protein